MAAGTKSVDDERVIPPGPDPTGPELRRSWIKITALLLGAGVLLTVAYVSPLRQYLGRWHEVSQQIRSLGALAPLGLVLSVAALVGIGFPRLVLCIIAGMALGFWSGLLWAQLGTFLGNYVVFLVVRAGGRDWAQRLLSKRPTLGDLVQRRGVLGVILARQMPLPGLVVNLACGLLTVGHLDFIVGTLIGQLPQAIPCTLIGAGVLQPSFNKGIGLIGVAVIALILAWFGIRYLLRREKQ